MYKYLFAILVPLFISSSFATKIDLDADIEAATTGKSPLKRIQNVPDLTVEMPISEEDEVAKLEKCCEVTMGKYRIITSYILEWGSMFCQTGTVLCTIGTSIVGGINKFGGEDNPHKESIETATFCLATTAMGLSLLGSWATKESEKRRSLEHEKMIQHKKDLEIMEQKLEEKKNKIADLKNQISLKSN